MGALKRPGPNPNQPPPDPKQSSQAPETSPKVKGPWIIQHVDAATLTAVIVIALLLPLLITGFLSP
jgi:hypothetical protein